MKDPLKFLISTAHSPIENYVVPGLTSYLIGLPAKDGSLVRLFHSAIEQEMFITPHSHRYDSHHTVLKGEVKNIIYTPPYNSEYFDEELDEYYLSELIADEGLGEYVIKEVGPRKYRKIYSEYSAGESYAFSSTQIHSIKFGKNTYVLVVQGFTITDTSAILEPYIAGERVPTFTVEDWMFKGKPDE